MDYKIDKHLGKLIKSIYIFRGKSFFNLFYVASISLISNPVNDHLRKKFFSHHNT